MSETSWLVQRRMSGVQGENGCWADEGIVEASSAEEAARVLVAALHPRDSVYRVAPVPEWEKFDVGIETHHSVEVLVAPHDGPDIADSCEPLRFDRICKLIGGRS